MLKLCVRTIVPILITSFAAGCAGPAPVPLSSSSANSNAQAARPIAGELHYRAPEGWASEQPTSNMRVAQYRLPKVEGDAEDASLVVYYFGQGQGGSVEANLDRWMGQMVQPDGKPSKEKAKTDTKTVNGLKVTRLDVSGRYTAEMAPGSSQRHDNADYRMQAAVVETPKGAYYVKLVGPEKTIAKWETGFAGFIDSFEFK